jgi:hypothetical protein
MNMFETSNIEYRAGANGVSQRRTKKDSSVVRPGPTRDAGPHACGAIVEHPTSRQLLMDTVSLIAREILKRVQRKEQRVSQGKKDTN